MEKQVKQLSDLIDYRNIVLEQKNKTELLNYEKSNNLIALYINYHKKEYYKEKYGTQWHIDFKLWFVNISKIRNEELCEIIYLG